MGNLLSGSQKQNPDELKQVRQARIDYQNYLQQVQTNTNTDVNSKRLTPESGQLILAEVKKGVDWLQKYPNANFSEVLANHDARSTEIKRISSLDVPKREYYNSITALPTLANQYNTEKRIDKLQKEKLIAVSEEHNKWYSKQSSTATPIDISQQQLKLNDTIVTILPDKQIREPFQKDLNKTKTLSPGDLISTIEKAEADIQMRKSQQVDVQEGIDIVMSTAVKVFLGFLLVAFCIVAGSLAANFAIGRSLAYRILYFLWGAIPIFSPFVYLYALYKRLYDGRFPYYAILPLSTEAATTRLGTLLMYPFYYVPDHEAVKAYDMFTESLKSIQA
jgi:hypothetical protein